MPVPYRYWRCAEVPKLGLGERIKSTAQLSTPWGDDQAHSILEYLGLAEYEAFDRYSVEHQMEREVDAIFNHEPVRRLIVRVMFPAFYERERGYFLACTSRKVVRGFFERMATAKTPLLAEEGALDMQQLVHGSHQLRGEATGAYFAQLALGPVRSASIFGNTEIVESDEWQRYDEAGVISAVHMELHTAADTRKVMVCKDRTVLLMAPRNPKDDLAFVAEAQEALDQLSGDGT